MAATNGVHELYLICDDLDATIAPLKRKGVEVRRDRPGEWGRSTGVTLPGGGKLGLYEARHHGRNPLAVSAIADRCRR